MNLPLDPSQSDNPLEKLKQFEQEIEERVNTQILKFSDEVKRKRKKAKMSQSDLARFAGVSRTQIANIESCRVKMSIKTMIRLAYYAGISLDEIFELKQ